MLVALENYNYQEANLDGPDAENRRHSSVASGHATTTVQTQTSLEGNTYERKCRRALDEFFASPGYELGQNFLTLLNVMMIIYL